MLHMYKKIKNSLLIRLGTMKISLVLVNTQVGKANLTDIGNLDIYGNFNVTLCYRIVMELQQNKNGSL